MVHYYSPVGISLIGALSLEHELRQEGIGIGHRFDVRMRNSVVGSVAGSQFIETFLSRVRFEGNEGALVTHRIAIIWSRENRYALATMRHFIAIGLNLVGSYHIIEVIKLEECFCNVRTKLYAHSSFRR